MMIIDATDAILGRVSSYVSKQLLKGENIEIVNAEKIIITGKPSDIEKKYLERIQRGSPQHGPFYPKRPDLIVSRAIRGMLPRKKPSGKAALGKLRVHLGVPKQLASKDMIRFAEKQKAIECDFVRIEDLSRKLGWKGE